MANKQLKQLLIGDGSGNLAVADFNVEKATDIVFGINKLSDATDSDLNASTGQTAATPLAVKKAYDKAKQAYDLAQQGGSGGGGSGGYIVTPKITSPTQDETDVSTILTISGTGFKSVFPDEQRTHRTFQVSKSPDFATTVFSQDVDADEIRFSDQLDAQTKYYIRIKDVTPNFESSWSVVVSFTTGQGIKPNTPTITISGEPNRITKTPKITTSEFNVSGGSDTHKSTTWIIKDKDTSTEVYKSENDTTNKTSLTVPGNKLEWQKSYVVEVFYTGNTYGKGGTARKEFTVMTEPPEGDIGTPDTIGFGVGIAPEERAKSCGLTLISDDPTNEHYGNYRLNDNVESISVYIPPFWVRVGDNTSPRYAKYGLNCVDFKPFSEFSSEEEAAKQKYFMPEGFFNKGEIVGFFFDKYINSEDSSGKYISKEKANPKLKYNTAAHEIFTKCKQRGAKWNGVTIMQVAVLRFIALIQAQYCTSTTNCGWWDGNNVMNFPKGNNNYGTDYNDPTVKGTGNSDETLITGSCTPREKTTHNGQKNGICDVNGTCQQFAWGVTTDSSNTSHSDIFIKKRSVDFSIITFDIDGVNDAFGSETHLLTLYDKTTMGSGFNNEYSQYWGNESNQVLKPYDLDKSHRLCCICPKEFNSISYSGTNLFGQDYFNNRNPPHVVPFWCGHYTGTTVNGIFYTSFNGGRTNWFSTGGARSAAYGN